MYHSATPQCGPSGGCVQCVGNSDCSALATAPFCGPSNTCVQCLKASDCTPQVCGSNNQCRNCQTHAECPSGACNFSTGKCVDPSMVYYVDNAGMTVVNCNAARPTQNGTSPATAYCDATGVPGDRAYVVVTGHGTNFPYGWVTLSTTQTWVGPGFKAAMPALLTGSPSGAGIVVVSVNGANVTIDGFEINGQNAKDGIDCTSTKASGAHDVLTVLNSYIHNTANGAGILPKNCDLVVDSSRVSAASIRAIDDTTSTIAGGVVSKITNSEFDGNTADALDFNGVVTIDRCLIHDNSTASGNGLQLNNSTFTVTNTFFYNNAQAVEFAATGTPQSIFMFNTVAYNRGGGFACAGNTIQATIYIHNNDGALVGGAGPAQCRTIDIVTDNAANLPVFVNVASTTTYDFHLATDTPAHLAANQACCIDKVKGPLDGGTSPLPTHDFDGTMRPQGMGYDIGAHEAK
jgi:hypothetical protein